MNGCEMSCTSTIYIPATQHDFNEVTTLTTLARNPFFQMEIHNHHDDVLLSSYHNGHGNSNSCGNSNRNRDSVSSTANESSPLFDASSESEHPRRGHRSRFIRQESNHWFPSSYYNNQHRTLKRRFFLFLTEPSTSIGSAIFFGILIITIALSNIIMILQTMHPWQFLPTDCVSCGGPTIYLWDDDIPMLPEGIPCVCPPAPLPSTVLAEDGCVYFFTVEWILRVLLFEPHRRATTLTGRAYQRMAFFMEPTTWMDALAIVPYYLERFHSTKGLLSLRLLRLFRVFQLVRLGQYNETFTVFTNVMTKSVVYLKLLLLILLFGAAFFGSMVFWLEKGHWMYWEETGNYQFIRLSSNGVTQEISPFLSIPQAFWWFLVTSTTVGYGDMAPTTTGGKMVAIAAMLTGVLVIAFPVSVFSDLWNKEIEANYNGESLVGDDKEKGEEVHDTDSDLMKKPRVQMERQDIQQLAMEFKVVELAQKRIRGILNKYDIPIE